MRICTGLLAFGLLAGIWGCEPPKTAEAHKAPSPAKVEKPAKEETLGTITLEPKAEKRLGVETAEVKLEPVVRSRAYAGDIIVPPGRLIVVSAPFIGTLVAPPGGIPTPGTALKKGQTVIALLPLLSPEARATMTTARVDAEGKVDQAKKQLAQAEQVLKRNEELRRGNPVIGMASIDDSRALRDIAKSALAAAEANRDVLERTIRETGIGSATPMPLFAPEDGVLRNVQALEGQQVAAAAILFEVERVDPVWVRVPVYVGEKENILTDRPAAVGSLSDPTGTRSLLAKPVKAPPAGDPLALTVDLFYEVPNPEHAFNPGQKVGVSIPMKGEETALVVPRSAVYLDYNGGSWIYEQLKEHTYIRRRVGVDHIAGELAILARGPKPGTKVMTVGVAEVFGTEFGFAK
jgi:RND family efflux transporter MFP subunit